MGPTVKESMRLASEIDSILAGLPEQARIKAGAFLDSVGKKTRAIAGTIARQQCVTPAQMLALQNMCIAVRRWQRN